MARGTYERTPLILARQKLTRVTNKIEKLAQALDGHEAEKQRLAREIETLEKAESK